MPMKDSFTSVRLQLPGRGVALAGLALAASTTMAGLAVGAPLSPAWPPRTAGDLLPLLGGGLPLLALMGSALSLFGGAKPTPEKQAMVEVRALTRELTEALEVQRAQVVSLQHSCEAAMAEAAAVSNRVSAIANTAVDAETRLAAGVENAEKALKQPVAVVSLAAEATQRVERALPELAEMIRSSLAAAPNQAFTAAAERLSEAVEGAVRTFRGAIEEASGKISALDDISAALRRDARTLDLAAREIATAGATVVTRAGETISSVDQSIAALPAAVASVAAAAARIDDVSSQLRADGTALDGASQKAEKVVEALVVAEERIGSERQAMEAAAERMAEMVVQVDAVRTDAARMAELTEQLRDAATVLTGGTGSLDQAGQRVAAGVESAFQEIRAAGEKMMTEIVAALAPLPDAAAQVTGATGRLSDMSDRLAEGSVRLERSSHDLAQRGDETERKLAGVADTLMARATEAIGPITEAATTLAGSAGEASRAMAEAATDLRTGRTALEASGRESMLAAATLLKEAESIRTAGQAVTDTDWKAAAEAVEAMRRVADTLTVLVEGTEPLRQDLACLGRMAGSLEQTTASLTDGAIVMDAAGQRLAASGESVVERLASSASRHEASLLGLPIVANEITSAAAELRGIADAIPTTLPGTLLDATMRLEGATPGIEQLAALTRRLETVADTLPGDLAARVGEAVPTRLLEAAGLVDALGTRLEGVAANLPADLASRFATMTPSVDRLDKLGERLEQAIDRLPEELASGIPAFLPKIAARLETIGARLDQLDALGGRLDALINQSLADDKQEAATATLAVLSGDIGDSVRRVEAALSQHDGALALLASSIERVQAAGAEFQAARTERAAAFGEEGALAATLHHLETVSAETEALLCQTEALAEIVMAGRAPGLSSVLADHVPSLLSGVEATTRRLRSVATALALAADGPADARRAR